MLVTGMFVMYVYMQDFGRSGGPRTIDRPTTVESTDNSLLRKGDAASESNAQAPTVPGKNKQHDQELAETPNENKLADLPSLTEMQQQMLANDVPSLQYDFTKNKSAYRFSLQLSPDKKNEKVSFSGRTYYTPKESDPEDFIDEDLQQESTGTGFIIHPQGMILTCAHVIDRAEEVQVTIDGELHNATVVGTDEENDLALLRVNADDLSYLSITTPDEVDQGDNVRVFGFPLTDLLGESMKITSGSIIGFSDNANEVQIDATVNPGNSGGPVVDQYGNVVAVASALLDAEGISSVGLGVNIEKVSEFLGQYKVPFATVNRKLKRRDIKEAVVFIKNHGRSVDTDTASVVRFSSYFNMPGTRGGFITNSQRRTDDGNLVLDGRGTLANPNESQKTLPLIFERLCEIGIEELPRVVTQNPWSRSTQIIVSRTKQERREQRNPLDMHGFGFRPRGFGGLHDPFGRFGRGRENEVVSEKTVTIICNQTEKLHLKSQDDDKAVFKKYFKISTVQSPDEQFNINLKYDGTFSFDKQQQRITKGKFRGDVITHLDGELTRIPILYTYELIPAEQLQKERDKRDAAAKKQRERKARVDAITSDKLDLYDPEK